MLKPWRYFTEEFFFIFLMLSGVAFALIMAGCTPSGCRDQDKLELECEQKGGNWKATASWHYEFFRITQESECRCEIITEKKK